MCLNSVTHHRDLWRGELLLTASHFTDRETEALADGIIKSVGLLKSVGLQYSVYSAFFSVFLSK